VFNENSSRTRQNFFQNALIQHLWSRFVQQEPKIVSDFFSTLKQQERSALRIYNFKQDVAHLQQATGFEIIPKSMVTI